MNAEGRELIAGDIKRLVDALMEPPPMFAPVVLILDSITKEPKSQYGNVGTAVDHITVDCGEAIVWLLRDWFGDRQRPPAAVPFIFKISLGSLKITTYGLIQYCYSESGPTHD